MESIKVEAHPADDGFEIPIDENRFATRYNVVMFDWSQCPEVERKADKLSGAWVFTGTRVPVRALFENLESGATIDDFLEWFPGVTREQVVAVLHHASAAA